VPERRREERNAWWAFWRMWVVRSRGTRRVDLRSRGMRLVGRGEGAVGGSARRAAVAGEVG